MSATIPSPHDGSLHPGEEVDGKPRHTHNSEGNLIHPSQEGRANFHRWFSASPLTDEHGRPKVLYHGSTSDFHTFSGGEFGFHLADNPHAAGLYGEPRKLYLNAKKPFHIEKDLGDWKPETLLRWLSSRTYKGPGTGIPQHEQDSTLRQVRTLRKKHGADLQRDPGEDPRQRQALYAVGKPVRDLFEKHGYDSISYRNEGEGGTSYIAFHPHQIKAAEGNSGGFSRESPHVQEAQDFLRRADAFLQEARKPYEEEPYPPEGSPHHVQRAWAERIAGDRSRRLHRKHDPEQVSRMPDEELKAHLRALTVSLLYRGSGLRPKEKATLQTMQKQWPHGPKDLEEFRDHIEQEHGVTVRKDGLASFETITPHTKKIIGDLPVVVYHHTSSRIARTAREEGLQHGLANINRGNHESSGVYVTTEHSGPAAEMYRSRAAAHHGGHPVTLSVKTHLRHLSPDPDDADLVSVARRQFVLPEVKPEDLL
jgi:hypothetical protein